MRNKHKYKKKGFFGKSCIIKTAENMNATTGWKEHVLGSV